MQSSGILCGKRWQMATQPQPWSGNDTLGGTELRKHTVGGTLQHEQNETLAQPQL